MCVCKKDMFYCHFLKIIRKSRSLSESSVSLFSSVVVSVTSLLSTKVGTDCSFISYMKQDGEPWGTGGLGGLEGKGYKTKNFLCCTCGYLCTTVYISVFQLVEIVVERLDFCQTCFLADCCIPYACHYKPRLVYILPLFSLLLVL